MISSLKSNEVYLSGNEPPKKSKSIALKSKGKSSKALQVIESNQETPYGDYEDGSDAEEMAFMTKRFQYLIKKKRFSDRSSGPKGSGYRDKKYDQKGCFNCKKYGHFTADML